MKTFQVVGYYILEVVTMPAYLEGLGERLLSVSSCLGELHPKFECIFLNGWREGEKQAFMKKMQLSDGQYADYVETVRFLAKEGLLDSDGRFLRLSDAVDFYEKYCGAVSCRLVSLATTPEYFGLMASELTDGNGRRLVCGETDDSKLAGYDILGWDIGGFHSFLCNALHEELPEAVFNALGLLKNEFDEVADFARRIQGKGEPVLWIPCRVGEVLCSG